MFYSVMRLIGLAMSCIGASWVHKNDDIAPETAPAAKMHEPTPLYRALKADRIEGALWGATLGDALGRVTEFIETTDEIIDTYGTQGVRSFKDFRRDDWIRDPQSLNLIAAYTDDTVMSLIVLEEALRYRSLDQFVYSLKVRFRELFGTNALAVDPLYFIRAHGIQNQNACLNVKIDERSLEEIPSYDREPLSAVAKEGGCGSVMRAWPLGLVFSEDLHKVALLADYQSRITHRNPMARAASAAIAVGVASLINGSSPDTAVEEMINAARKFEVAERLYKPLAHTLREASSITDDRLLTADMIAYAAEKARSGVEPRFILGTHNTKIQYRSSEGFLLGWAADEAVAAAVYVFLRHPNDLAKALQESVNTPGDSDSIATLAGALVGAHAGWESFKQTGFDYSMLENKEGLERLTFETINNWACKEASAHN